MRKSVLSVGAILALSLLLAVSWVDLSLGSRRVELGPLGVPVQFSCSDSLARERGLALERMPGTSNAILEVKKHVKAVEMEINEGQSQAAAFWVSVTMNSGNRVECRMPAAQWDRLDGAMARTIRRCVSEFMAFKRERGGQVSGVVLTI